MNYIIDFDSQRAILYLKLSNFLSLEEFQAINQDIQEAVLENQKPWVLAIDIEDLNQISNTMREIQSSQRYLIKDKNLSWILVVGGSKLMKLSMMLLFSLSTVGFRNFETSQQMEIFLELFHSPAAKN